MSHSNSELPDPRLIRHALEKLRGRDGLTAARLLASRNGDAAALLGLESVHRYAAVHDVDPTQAVLELIKECVRENLAGSHRVVADAIFGLGSLSDTYARRHVEARVIAALSSDLLGRRRQTLLSRWNELHEALSLDTNDIPSDRILRGTVEPEVLNSLAEALIRREIGSGGGKNAVPSRATKPSPSKESDAPTGRILVIGGAVMDMTYRIKTLPQIDTAVEAASVTLSPGGKALYQAIAAARLGLTASLVAAVARDAHGDEILAFLQREGVDVSLVKRIDGARTPFTTVHELELGESAAVYCRDSKVRLEASDIEEISDHIFSCDVVLMTFEAPRETLEAALRVASLRDDTKPFVIVTSGQPYDKAISGQSLSVIDYLVARPQELVQYQSHGAGQFDVNDAARVLMTQGVKTLCVTDSRGCSVYSHSIGQFPVPTFPSPYREAAIARDAFCAALAVRLIEADGIFSEEVALWATAAMAATTADHPISNPMPDRRRVQRILDSSPFNVSLRSETRERPDNKSVDQIA